MTENTDSNVTSEATARLIFDREAILDFAEDAINRQDPGSEDWFNNVYWRSGALDVVVLAKALGQDPQESDEDEMLRQVDDAMVYSAMLNKVAGRIAELESTYQLEFLQQTGPFVQELIDVLSQKRAEGTKRLVQPALEQVENALEQLVERVTNI